uniref:Transaminase n=1 Tax=Priestia megaterium TaxID=1404 RepID=A0A1C7D190_PRIMG|nr:Chain A, TRANSAMINASE [Priestia megaterium]5G09_B Chain B, TRANSAMINASE [Priestia megaterium]5G09_C Chain C, TRANSAMINASE [Priestia megaterium]5G09_D Chain D, TRANSAMINASE [Priestia megaterium]5G0A_A Chain A, TRANSAMINASE [Priestia megaterium]5G0A_B Chain B, TRANSAMINASE [Priestia megaterium]5G0A_C Chain C, TRANSAMINASE [Priestia megaterium]5G0A_D Chain D, TRANSAMINASE [Priestia megaterium]
MSLTVQKINWEQVKEWDRKYLMRTFSTQNEYQPVPIESTEGDYLIMPDGTRLLDFFNQLYCVNLGQKNQKVNAAIKEALDRYGFVWDTYATDYKAKAAKIIIEDILGDEDWPGKVRFVSTGSEAVETALNIARLYTNRPLVVTREHDYHGWTGGAATVTRLRSYRSGLVGENSESFSAQIPGSSYNSAVLMAPSPNMFQDSDGNLLKDENGELLSVKYTRRMIENYGPEQVAAVITEVSQGAGSAMPPYEYIPQIRKMTKELGVLWINDEVLTGFGRTGKWFGYQHYGVQPDIITMGKGLSSSSLPAGAVLVSKEIAAFMDKHRWESVSTYAGHPVAMAAVCANLEVMMEENFVEQAKDSGEYIRSKLELLQEKHKSIGNFDGYGLLWIVDIVNAKTKTPYVKLDRNFTHGMNPNQIPTQIIMKKALEKGVLIGGVMPNTMRIGASLNVSRGDIDKAMDALDYALDYLESGEWQALEHHHHHH